MQGALSLPLCRTVLSCVLPPALRSIKKINYDIYEGLYINFDLWFLICGVLFILEIGEAFKADFIGDAFFFSWLTVLILFYILSFEYLKFCMKFLLTWKHQHMK